MAVSVFSSPRDLVKGHEIKLSYKPVCPEKITKYIPPEKTPKDFEDFHKEYIRDRYYHDTPNSFTDNYLQNKNAQFKKETHYSNIYRFVHLFILVF